MIKEVRTFKGFSKESVSFLKRLKKNNNKNWFENHKSDYENSILMPSRDFVVGMGHRLKELSSGVNADPRVNKSLFKIHRDTRFSNDKTPYKTNLGIWFWEGESGRFDCSGFYFHLEPPNMMLGAGIYMFSKHIMAEYRNSVVHKTHGPALVRTVNKVMKAGNYQIGGQHYKKTPRGFDPEHKNTKYLLHNGFYAMYETKIPVTLYSKELVDYCHRKFKDMLPVHKWLCSVIKRALK